MKQVFTPVLVALVGIGGFGLGKFVKIEEVKPPVTVENFAAASKTEENTANIPAKTGMYVAARGGTAYFLPWCAAAERIADKNKIWFATKEEAERAGYRPAKNCKGL